MDWHIGGIAGGEASRDAAVEMPQLTSKLSPTENAPAGSRGEFWGYYREERYVSLYMWIRGR
jgi:hypothetical protein